MSAHPISHHPDRPDAGIFVSVLGHLSIGGRNPEVAAAQSCTASFYICRCPRRGFLQEVCLKIKPTLELRTTLTDKPRRTIILQIILLPYTDLYGFFISPLVHLY